MSLCVSVFVDDPGRLRERLEPVLSQARMVELRLDRAPEMDFAALAAALPVPVVAACPRSEEGGHFDGGEAARAARLQAAASGGARFVDLPLGAPRPTGLPPATHVVHSWHEAEGERADLRQKLLAIEALLEPGDVAKVVGWADEHAGAARVLALYGATRAPLVAFAQGPGGRATRAWAPALGAPWTYACLPEEETASGQWTVQDLFALHPPGGAGAQTSLYALVGSPVAHSRSPLLWNTALRMSRLDAFYLALEVERFDGFLGAHAQPNFRGFSVTAPFKADALRSAGQADEAARAIGAANTLIRVPQGWRACNTDGPAALDALEAAGARAPGRLLVLGAGGAARAAVHEALQRGWKVCVAARRAAAAADLAARLGAAGVGLPAVAGEDWDAVVHATPVGSDHAPGNLLGEKTLSPGTVVLDMVYAPARTALLEQAREHGCKVVPGYEMLLRQMLRQFPLLTGTEAAADPLRRVLEADLGMTP